MNKLESELFDLEELLMQNDGVADDGIYSTIVGIANDVSELEVENDKLKKLVQFANQTVEGLCGMVENSPGCALCPLNQDEDRACGAAELFSRIQELGLDK